MLRGRGRSRGSAALLAGSANAWQRATNTKAGILHKLVGAVVDVAARQDAPSSYVALPL